ncbi:MAG: hypothetical protein KGL53_13300, partial [Elusimicrobia bacterium]|nr:hypothetical protein [Elusimicrobiota bacterium]
MTSPLLAFLLLLAAAPARADCSSPPASWGSDWSAYQGWCESCCGVFHRAGTQSRCDPGPNWGCRGTSSGSGAGAGLGTAPTTLQGAVLQGIQSGIQQGLQNAARQRQLQEQRAAEERARRQAEEARAEEVMRQANEAAERGARANAASLEDRRRAAS